AHHCSGEDGLSLACSQGLIGLVFECDDVAPFIVVAHPSFENDARPRSQVVQLPGLYGCIDCRGRKVKAAHPPDTGGRNTTSSPSCSGFSQSTMRPLTATRKRSLGNANSWRRRISS